MSDPTLPPDDEQALDRLVEAGYSAAEADPTGQDRRLAEVASVLRRLDALPSIEPSEDLTSRTLARIQRAIDEEERALRVAAGTRSWWTRASRSVAAAAAIIVIGLVALWPALSGRDALEEARSRQGALMAGFDASRWLSGGSEWGDADLSTLPASPAAIPIAVEGAQGYSGPVTIRARWVQRTIELPDGSQAQVWRPILVIVPLEESTPN